MQTNPPHSRHPLRGAQFVRTAIVLSSFIALQACQSTTKSSASIVEAQDRSYTITKIESPRQPLDNDWNNRIVTLFEQARSLVSNHTGVDLSDVKLNIASDSTITKEVGVETKRLIQNQFDNQHFASLFLDSVMHGQSGTYAALYATRKAEVMISMPLMQNYQRSLPNDPQIQTSAILALLVHELVHAADDKRYNIHKNRDLNFRASFAQSATFEGHAQYQTRKICAQANCLSGLEALDQFMFGTSNPPNALTQTVQAVSRNVLEYSYVEGERFVTALANRPNGQQLIENLLTNPPQDPIQILDPKSFPNTQREQRNQELIRLSTQLDHPWLRSPWKSVQTSPLKGVNLRSDPTLRDAAVDGFTRLITSMVALQLYDQSQNGLSPIELTVVRTESRETAKLFAQNLYENTQIKGASLSKPRPLVKVSGPQNDMEPAMLYVAQEPAGNNQTYYTLVGVSGLTVVQVGGLGENEALFVDYIDKLLIKLGNVQSASL